MMRTFSQTLGHCAHVGYTSSICLTRRSALLFSFLEIYTQEVSTSSKTYVEGGGIDEFKDCRGMSRLAFSILITFARLQIFATSTSYSSSNCSYRSFFKHGSLKRISFLLVTLDWVHSHYIQIFDIEMDGLTRGNASASPCPAISRCRARG